MTSTATRRTSLRGAAALCLGALLGPARLLAGDETGSLGLPEGLSKGLAGLDAGSASLWARGLVLVTVLGVVPSIVLLTTCYPRVLIVLSFLRRALGAPDLPSSQILAGLALILTAFIMMPVWKQVYSDAYLPLSRGELEGPEEALEKAAGPVRRFMLARTFEKDLRLFVELSQADVDAGEEEGAARSVAEERSGPGPERGEGETVEGLDFFVVLPAFVLSELKVAFQMGFLLFLPFLAIDLAVSAVLLSLGMFMLPPAMVSLPLKVLVFVLVDGWSLVVGQLVQGFQGMS
ncbi:MAG: flagellar type III secretion system pore protein FliP [Planctomycetes bacterium]|nr:flagellar type III secretion system pore protein FliP [Planctomycetota bacterium]